LTIILVQFAKEFIIITTTNKINDEELKLSFKGFLKKKYAVLSLLDVILFR